jgi:cobaltochelatase CobN
MALLKLVKAALLALLLVPAWATAQIPAPAATTPPPGAPAARVSFLFSDNNIPGFLAAYRKLQEQRPDLRDRVEVHFLTESTFGETPAEAVAASDVLVFDVMNQQLLDRFDAEHATDLIGAVKARGMVLGVGEGLQTEDHYAGLGVTWDPRARAYFAHAGPRNQLALLQLALARAGVSGFDLPDPELSLDFGYYHPEGESGRVFSDWEAFQAWRAANGKLRAGAPRVAVGFFKASYYSGDMALIDAVIAEIERRGAEAVPVFGYPGAIAFERLLGTGAQVRADVGLGLFFQFNDAESAKVLERVGIPVINLVSLYGRSAEDWRTSSSGLSAFEGTFNLASPELAGTVAPTVVGTKEKVRDPATGLTSVITSPIPERVAMAVSRGLRYAELSRKPNTDKKIALIYYNYPPGKANIGASYLNVAESLANILARMAAEGYDLGRAPPTADEVLADITSRGRNIAGHAPGELEAMIAEGGVRRIPIDDYRRWLDALEPSLRDKILADWGDPAETTLMVERRQGEANLIVPAVEYGNVLLMPQPSRAWSEDLEKLYHAEDLAPQHQYVAAYAWLRNGFGADAVVHVGTHGTLEWLDGRDVGLGPEDAPDALIADLPDAYIYNVDVVGEGLVARRRGMATLVDHMVPPFVEGGLSEDLARLSGLLNDHVQNEGKNAELAALYGRQARDAAIEMGIAKDLGFDPAADWTDEQLHSVETYLLDLRGQIIPFGLHAFGRVPEPAAIDSTVRAIAAVDRTSLPDAVQVFEEEMRGRIEASGERELAGLMKALGGRFVPAGKGGEPIRNPDAYPTGANFYGIDPAKIPKPAAWEIGSRLAQQMLDNHVERHGRYPAKVSFVIWGDETMRHEGILESQIFYLLGTRPVWDARGTLVDVEVVPRETLGRPRVDIVIASASEGLFQELTRLMDAAVQKVKALDEPDNQVREHYLAIKQALIASGVAAEEAEKMAGVRIFDEPPGRYNLNTSGIVGASGSWDSEDGFANDYISKMGHGYGNGYWGQPMPDVFRLALSGTDTVVHSNSTMLYGTLDNDDMFMYMGGLASAIRSLDGKTPELLITDTRDPGKSAMASLDQFIGREFRSRYVNPNWIRGMQQEGYAGAGAMREFVEYLWGWDATATDVVDDAMWQETYETYVVDKAGLGMKDYFERHSPFAFQDMTARMIETVRKDYWRADEETKARLVSEYLDSVTRHGVNCTDVSCGNGRLLRYVMDEAARTGVAAETIESARAAFEQSMGRSIDSAADELEAFARRNDARAAAERIAGARILENLPQPVPIPDGSNAAPPASAPAAGNAPRHPAQASAAPSGRVPVPGSPQPPSGADNRLTGQLMTEEDRTMRLPPTPSEQPLPVLSAGGLLWPAALFFLFMLVWAWLDRRQVRALPAGLSA